MFADPRGWTAIAAAGLPSLLAFNVAPSPTFLNQALAFALWGWFCCAGLLSAAGSMRQAAGAAAWPLAGLMLLLASATWAMTAGPLPASLGLSAIGTLGAALLLLLAGSACRGEPAVGRAFAWAWLTAGLASVAIALVQVFAPSLADGDWIAISSVAGRAVGNLRQPNHLASLLLWSAVALIALVELKALRARVAAAIGALFVLGLVLSASRTGMVGVLLLALWVALDRGLSKPARWLLLSAPLVYALQWWLMSLWAAAGEQAFFGQTRLAEGDLSASRIAIWRDTLALIAADPWWGVGFGAFNFAWSLSVLPHRPIAFFDHTHNLPLQWWAELGIPLGSIVLAAAVGGLWLAWRRSAGQPAARSAAVMIVTIGLHSLLEYPLWYAYFLLPAAWAWGYALGAGRRGAAREPPAGGRAGPAVLAGGALLSIGAALSVADYVKVVRVFSAAPEPLGQRIEAGQRSLFFAHHADYAAATVSSPDAATPADLAPFASSAFHLLDTRLMTAWAEALAQRGDVERARHIAARLREFRNKASEPYFAPCAESRPPEAQQPYQCEESSSSLSWRDFLPRP